jgi:hypothetical protein
MSWSGTVRCSNCYESGHNITSCPDLKKAWEEDPTSYNGRRWQGYLDKKAKPKICGYCDESGHTRAGCDTAKAHKVQFAEDLLLWRAALVKWMEDVGLGIGALVQCDDANYYRGETYMYANDENHIPAVGMIMHGGNEMLTHYHGIMNAADWMSGPSLFSFQYIGASLDEAAYRTNIGITLPCIPGIVPRLGEGYYGNTHMDRQERLNNVDWKVVSPGQASFPSDAFIDRKKLKKVVKENFAAPQEQTSRSFRTFEDFQRTQLRQYVNGEIELSEMKDPEVPGNDT